MTGMERLTIYNVSSITHLLFEENEEYNGKANDEDEKDKENFDNRLSDLHEHGNINPKQAKTAEKQHQVGITEEYGCDTHYPEKVRIFHLLEHLVDHVIWQDVWCHEGKCGAIEHPLQ